MKTEHISEIITLVNKFLSLSIYKDHKIDLSKLLFDQDFWNNFNIDYQKNYKDNNYKDNIIRSISLQGILCYRIARNLYLNNLESDAEIFSNLGRILSGMEIFYSADIGYGLKINHGLGIVIGARCKIGNNCLLHQGITIGDRNSQRPTIEDNVTIFAGAKILGGINIGKNAVIGANAVVITNIPENTTAVGVPARIIIK